jgi:hypothetical protein
MPKIQEATEITVSETENIILECKERIWQALEVDSHKLKEKAELECSQILAGAREEAEKTIAQARQEALAESGRIISQATEKAAQIINISREESVKAQQESARMINETRLLTQVNKSVEQTINETGINTKAKLERLASIIADAESALQSMSETQNKEEDIPSPTETGEAVIPEVLPIKKTDPTNTAFKDKQSITIKYGENSRLFEGRINLEVIRPFDQERLAGVPEWLNNLKGLKVTPTGCYARANRWITQFSLDLEQPLPLLEIFETLQPIKEAIEHRGSIVITMK